MDGNTFSTWEIEDYLSDKECFVNGITNEPAHSDSYMTILDYNKFTLAVKDSPYTKEQWLLCITEWFDMEQSIPLRLAAKELKRIFGC